VNVEANVKGLPRIAQRLTLPPGLRAFQRPVLVALAYFLGAEAAFFIGTLSDQIFALFWPPNVILFLALLTAPLSRWPLYIAAVFPAHVLAEVGVGMPAGQLVVAFATNCMVALLGAYGVQRLVGGPPWFDTFRNAWGYIFITAGLAPALSAFGGAFVPIIGGGDLGDYWIFWSHWYLANVIPSLTIGPAFLTWFANGTHWTRWTLSRDRIEPALLVAGIVAVAGLSVESQWPLGSGFLAAVLLMPLPLVLWAAGRFGAKGASGAILVVSVLFTWRTLHGTGLFPGETAERSVLALQLFIMGLSIPVLLLGTLIDELRRADIAKRQLTVSLLRAQDEERRRIARELHDSTGQNLIAATLISEHIRGMLPQAAERSMSQLDDMLQRSIKEVRTLSYLLHPPLLDEAGLASALRVYVDGFEERSGIAADLDVPADFGRLAPEVELILFRLVQEALGNVARHSNSPTAAIRLRRYVAGGPAVELTVEDEGRGFPRAGLFAPTQAVGPGLGLDSMRERVEQIDGHLEIESVPGRTCIRAVIPITGQRA